MAKKITIIGGSGFVGTNLCRQLSLKQQDFEIIDLKMSNQFPERCKIADVRNVESLRRAISGDVVVNLAAVHRDDVRNKSDYQLTNVHGAENVALVCSEKGIKKIVFTSTVAVYGFAEPGTDENGKINPFNEYGRTKFEAEEKLRAWQVAEDRAVIIIRPTVIFGEGNRGNVFNLFNQIYRKKFMMIGNGSNKKSMAYIGNVVAFLESCIETDEKYGLYNYIDTPDLTMKELVTLVRGTLFQKDNVGLQVPKWFGVLIGMLFDCISFVLNKRFSVSALRVKKFTTDTAFVSNKSSVEGFDAPYELRDAITRTLINEFVFPEPDSEIFFTE